MKIPDIDLRVDLINGNFELNDESIIFMTLVRTRIHDLAVELVDACPDDANVGRLIAAIDHLQLTKNLFCDAIILGNEARNRKPKTE